MTNSRKGAAAGDDHDVTELLLEMQASEGDDRKTVANRLYDQVYEELRTLAASMMHRERTDHTLQATALVNEAYLKMASQNRIAWEGRAHFFGIAARAMRQILVDHARKKGASKRQGDLQRVTLTERIGSEAGPDLEVLALHEALDRLAAEDSRMAQVVELRVFAGMHSREVAHVLDISKRTADQDWKVAKLWLARELSDEVADG